MLPRRSTRGRSRVHWIRSWASAAGPVLILFLLHTGCRFGEAAALDWSDVDLGPEPAVHIRRAACRGIVGETKTGRSVRAIPLTSELATALRAFKHNGQRVFMVNPERVLRPDVTEKHLKRIAARAGVEGVTWHVLRHTFATETTARRVPLRAVQELLGHTTITMTSRYAHVAPSTLRSAVEEMSRATPLPWSFGHLMDTKASDDVVHTPDAT